MGAIENFDIQKRVTDSVIETYSTMLSLEVEPITEEPPPGFGVHRMVGTLNFAGNVTGIFNVQVTVDFGRIMAAGLSDMEPDEVDLGTDVRDLLAEITNIVGGNLKSALNDAGHSCVLSTPSITYGTDFTIKSLNMDRFERCVFRKDAHILIVEVGLKAVEGSDSGLDFSTPDAMSRIPNVDLEKLNALDYKGKVSGAVIDVFDTMFSVNLEAVGIGFQDKPHRRAQRVFGVFCRRRERHRQHSRRQRAVPAHGGQHAGNGTRGDRGRERN